MEGLLPTDAMEFSEVVRLLRETAYYAYKYNLISGPPRTSERFARLTNPRVGDLVFETTTIHMRIYDMDGVGWLLRAMREPIKMEWNGMRRRTDRAQPKPCFICARLMGAKLAGQTPIWLWSRY